ncbi:MULTISPECIES: heavy metal-responsive transcriptional regulator [Oscillatoriales]|jgi:DNA-binding transcriptional MerR regulator|uniref:MerR family transcriptional regulator n=1 Tax=Limnospira platensis NIES-46 TaxID=1236695 RepID=A0A5M3T4X4_LIMPL|nr:heavy metal-responsive transcriptional regulator [Arthrospira platensis]MDT9182519.1 heavy metal-responsive transcriptional regulator [Limnospira sp. PMC 289.06]MDT9295189.1 heavy metal-responsive transcriptional regulator [Arthrospira platensis PCC 7345]GCE92940.1 MerR family transcriptional regulator [Arthrospira platensis NIES-46]
MFKVGEVSDILGINPQTIYFYERRGLIPSPQRNEAGYRLFTQEDLQRIGFIIRAKSLGLTLLEIKDILELKNQRSLTCQAVYERLNCKLTQIRDKIDQLQALHDELLPLVQECQTNLDRTNSHQQCVILDNYSHKHPPTP